MPIVNYGDQFDPIASARPINIARQPEPEAFDDPTVLETLGAAFRESNVVGSAIANETRGLNPREKEDGFNPLDEIRGTKYEARALDAAGIFNRPYFEAWKRQIDREEDDEKTLQSAGWLGTGASAVAAILDLPTLIPGGAVLRGAGGGISLARSAASVALAGGVGAAASEGALQATQQTRTTGESAIGIGSGIVFGGLLGGGAGALMSQIEKRAATKAIDGIRQASRETTSLTPVADEVEQVYRDGLAASAGAAARRVDTLEDLSVAGRAASAYAKATAQLNPVLRSVTSPSRAHREIMNGMMENSVYLKMNVEGRGSAAVETLQKQWDRGAYGAALEDHLAIWQEGRKAGFDMTREDFARAVGRAARRGDTGENEFVTRAAKAWRERVVEPLKRGAQETGQLPEDLPNRFDETYLHRVYRRDRIIAQEPQFKAAIRPYIESSIDDALRIAERDGQGRPELDFVSEADRRDYVEGIVQDVFNKVTGLDQTDIPYGLVSVQQGPLKERTLNVPDRVLEPWLEDDIEMVNRRYARKMGADVELARRFGRADLKDQIDEIAADYDKLKQGVTDEKTLQDLSKRQRSDINDLKAIRDLLRGNYRPEANSTNFARIARAAGQFNFIRTMGGVTISSLNDVVRPAMVHGMTAYLRDGIAPMIRNLGAVKMSAKDAKLAGAISERILQSRMATLAELTDPYGSNSPFERLLDNLANNFSKLTLMNQWNDFNKTIASVMTQNRVLQNVGSEFSNLKSRERAYMGYLGIDESMAGRISREFSRHGEELDGVRVANTEAWTDEGARRAYYAAINKDVDTTIVTKGVGDVPLFANSPVGRAAIQFKSFAIASNQRMLMRGMQEGPGRAMAGIAGMATVGMFVYWLKNMEAGREASNNPGTWVAEGLDRSGIFAIGFEINNAIEKAGGPGAYGALSALGRVAVPGADAKQPASRFATRSIAESFVGPSFGTLNDVVGVNSIGLRALSKSVGLGDDSRLLAASDVQTLRRLTPYASLPYWRWLIDGGFGLQDRQDFKGAVPELKEAVE